ncbi:MAG: hypothetical protein JWN64_763 [Parcubacteria group bacterium]|nr:hypothetical protein [Parcubacteria group bacterium]
MDHRTRMRSAVVLALAMATTQRNMIIIIDDDERSEKGEELMLWDGLDYEMFRYRPGPMLERAALNPIESLLRERAHERTPTLDEFILDHTSLNFDGFRRREPNYERAFNQKIPIPRKLGRNMNASRKGRRQG